MGFNGDNLKAIFDQRFGKGAFDSGVSQAYQNGRSKWLAAQQAQAQQDFIKQQQLQEAKQKALLKDPVYQQKNASDYFTSGGTDRSKNNTLNDLLTKGAFQWVKDLQNDPMQQAKLKDAGYNIKAITDQAYNVASDSKYNDPTPTNQEPMTDNKLYNAMHTAHDTSNSQFKSAKAFGQYFKEADAQAKRDNAEAKTNTGFSNIDQIQQVIDSDKAKAAAAVQQRKDLANEQNSLLGKLNLTSHTIQNNGLLNVLKAIPGETWNTLKGLGEGAKNEFELGLKNPGAAYADINAGAQRIGDQFYRTVLGNKFADENAQEQIQSAKENLARNPHDPVAQHDYYAAINSASKATTPTQQALNNIGGFTGTVTPYLVGDGLLGFAGKATGMAGKVALNPAIKTVLHGATSGVVGSGLADATKASLGEHITPGQVLTDMGENALLGGAGNALLHGLGSMIKGIKARGVTDPAKIQQALEESGVPKHEAQQAVANDISNVLADQPMPKPFEQKYNINVPETPTPQPLNAKENDWFNFAQQGSNKPIGRGLFLQDTTIPRAQSGAIRSMAEDTLNRANAFSNAPAEGFNQRLLNVQNEMNGTRQANTSIQKEFKNAVQQQYEYLKGSMGKGTDSGTTSNGLDGNFKEVTGTYNVSKNPKWYQDFLKTSGGRKPNDTELRKLAEEHVRNGFQDEHGNLPAWKPQDLQHVHNQIDEIHSMLAEHPEQAHALTPILRGLEQDEARLTAAHNNVLSGKMPNINDLYANSKDAQDPKQFDELIKLAEMEHNQANPGLTSMLRSDPKIKQSIQALNNLGKPSKKAPSLTPKIEAPKGKTLDLSNLKPAKQNTHDVLNSLKVSSDSSTKGGLPKIGDIFKGLEEQKKHILTSINTEKNIMDMSKEELTSTLSKLEKKRELLSSGGKGNAKKVAAVEADIKKVNDMLVKTDLQQFGEKAPKEIPAAEKKTKQEKAIAHSQAKQVAKKIEEKGNPITADTVKQLQEMKDIGPNQVLTKNIYELADKLPKEIGDKLKAELDTAKSAHVDNLEKRSNEVYNKMVEGLKINKGSKESALVQDFGEKMLAKKYLEKQGMDPEKVSKEELDKINLEQLKQKAPDKWKNIVEADKYFRDEYNKLIDEVNTVRKQIYPKNPDKIVPKRDDYYHHFNQLEGFDHFKDLLMNSNAIDPHLAGISPNTKPNAKWAGFMQKRGNGAYKSDAVGGFLKYLQASSHSTHIDPMIKVLRDTAENIATATEGTKNLNNLKAALEDHANDLAGKTNPIDRLVQDKVIGRTAFRIINTVNNHIKKNMILGNIGSTLGQIGNVPLTLGKAKQYAVPGVMDTLSYAAKHLLPGASNETAPIAQSQFLKERFSGTLFRRFDNKLLKKPEHMAVWLLETADKSGTYFAWNSMYRKALSKGVVNPIKYADEQARHIVAGRGVGEVPIAQKSKIMNLVAPFTLEVGNAWKVLGKQMNEKDFAGVVTFLAASYGLNTVMRDVKGNDVSFNPVGAVMDGINDKKALTTGDKAKLAAGNLAGEIAGNIPGGSYIPQLLGGINPAAKKAIFGNNSPDRFGTGVGVTGTAFAPIIDLINGDKNKLGKDALKLALPFGGNQAQKTLSGSMALSKGGAFNKKGQLEYPIDSKNTADLLQSLLLGPSTASQGRTYFKDHQSALSDKQTQQYETAANKQDYYNKLQIQRQAKTIQKSMKDLQKDPSLTPQEKQQKLMVLIQQLQNLQK